MSTITAGATPLDPGNPDVFRNLTARLERLEELVDPLARRAEASAAIDPASLLARIRELECSVRARDNNSGGTAYAKLANRLIVLETIMTNNYRRIELLRSALLALADGDPAQVKRTMREVKVSELFETIKPRRTRGG